MEDASSTRHKAIMDKQFPSLKEYQNQNKIKTKKNKRKKFKNNPSKKTPPIKNEKNIKKVSQNIITIPIADNIHNDYKNIVEIDNFLVYEKESSQDGDNVEEISCENNNVVTPEESFDENDYNVMNDKKASAKLLQMSHTVEDFYVKKFKQDGVKDRKSVV